jgi:hypothetical protein
VSDLLFIWIAFQVASGLSSGLKRYDLQLFAVGRVFPGAMWIFIFAYLYHEDDDVLF